jgi:hypothetical protein
MKIKFCIPTSEQRFEKVKHVLLPTLLKNGIHPDDIYCFFMQSSDISLRKDQDYDINIVNINYNSIDFNAFIGIVDTGLVSDYWFYLHDTCYVTDYFYKRIQSIEESKDYDVIRATESGTCMNYGLYKNQFLYSIKTALLNYRNYDFSNTSLQRQKHLAVHHENGLCYPLKVKHFLNMNDPSNTYDVSNLKFGSYSNEPVILDYNNHGACQYYTDGVYRLLFFFKETGIYKRSANYKPCNDVKEWILNL